METERKKFGIIDKISPDLTHKYNPADIKKNKWFALLAFLSFYILPALIKTISPIITGAMLRIGTGIKLPTVLYVKPAILAAVFGVLFILSLFKAKESRYVKFYLNQGLSFSIWGTILSIVATFLLSKHGTDTIAVLILIAFVIYSVFGVVFGIYHIIKGKVRRNPIIGKKTFLKL